MNRYTLKYLQPIALLLVISVLFQCCMVYDKRPVSIDEAINVNHKKVKRIKVDLFGDKKLVLDSIYYRNGELYGLLSKSTKKNFTELKIEEEKIIRIRLYSRAKSTTGTVFLVLGGLGFAIFGLYVLAMASWAKYQR